MGYRTTIQATPSWARANGPFASAPPAEVTGQDCLSLGGQSGTTGHRVAGQTCCIVGGRFCEIGESASACIICGNEGSEIQAGTLNGCFGTLDTTITGGQSTVALGGDDNELGGDFCMMLGGYGNLIANCDRSALINALNSVIDAFVDGAVGFGRAVHIQHDGAFIIADTGEQTFTSARADELAVRMAGGMRLSLDGQANAFRIEPDGTLSAGETAEYASKVQDDNDLPNWAKVKQAVQHANGLSITVQGQPTDAARDVDVQLLDVGGDPLNQQCMVTAWISSTPLGTPDGSSLVDNGIQDGLGHKLRGWSGNLNGWMPALFVTDGQGRLRINLENQEQQTVYYLHLHTGGEVVVHELQLGAQ